MDMDAMRKQAMFHMENALYGGLLAKALEQPGIDVDAYTQFQSIVAAFNRRGVSNRIIFEVIVETCGGLNNGDE